MIFTFISEDAETDIRSGLEDIPKTKLTMEFSAVTMDEVLEEFEKFLRGSGYYLNNQHLELVRNDE